MADAVADAQVANADAAAGVAARRSVSNVEAQSDTGARTRSNVEADHTNEDVGTDEAQARLVAADSTVHSTHVANVNNLAIQALQNAVETANMVSKQAVRHSDIAINQQWTSLARSDNQGLNVDSAMVAAIVDAVMAKLKANG